MSKGLYRCYLYQFFKISFSAAAYYALYQTVYGYYYLDPYNKNDLKYWSAVATSYSLFYPDYYRTEPLRTQTLTAMSMSRDKSEMLQNIIVFTILEMRIIST